MADISQIDKNFKIVCSVGKKDVRYYNALSSPFAIYGVSYENGKFRRMSEAVAKTVSERVYLLHSNTAGGRIRFQTNSSYVALYVKMLTIGKMPHFAMCGSAGFDVYVKDEYKASFLPPMDVVDGYQGLIDFGRKKMREITINFPLYSDVSELYIGLQKDAIVDKPTPYAIEKPIVYYGSSITQGGCASRPGATYQGYVSRKFNADFINLGFSGSAQAEDEIIEYIKNLPMSVFVYDYDHNAPTNEHLALTHEKMFLAIREANPTLPIVIMSRPKYRLDKTEKARGGIIARTYENARLRGDNNVYFLDGKRLMSLAKGAGTVDGCHPTDLGFYSMATALIKEMEKFL